MKKRVFNLGKKRKSSRLESNKNSTNNLLENEQRKSENRLNNIKTNKNSEANLSSKSVQQPVEIELGFEGK